MTLFQCLLLGFLVVCAISVSFSRNLLNSILIYMSYSLVMSIIWICLESPDLAITEAAVGAGVTSVLFFVTLKKIHAIRQEDAEGEKDGIRSGENGGFGMEPEENGDSGLAPGENEDSGLEPGENEDSSLEPEGREREDIGNE